MKKENTKISKKMSFAEIIKIPKASEILMEEGLHCLSCPMAMSESLEQGCQAHGLNPDKIAEKINKKLRVK